MARAECVEGGETFAWVKDVTDFDNYVIMKCKSTTSRLSGCKSGSRAQLIYRLYVWFYFVLHKEVS